MDSSFPPYRRLKLHRPELQSVADCLDRAVRAAFVDASVEVLSECPDLSAVAGTSGFNLAGRGICGGATMVHVGGVPYLLPTPQADTRRYDLRGLLTAAGYPGGLAIGAGAASSAHFGKNAELIANVGPLGNGCRVASVANDSDYVTGLANCRLKTVDFAEVNLLGDLLCSEGKAGGPVLRLRASRWKPLPEPSVEGEDVWRVGHLTKLLQRTLGKEFAGRDLPVGLGGVFRLSGSAALMHVMPDFSSDPLTCPEEVDKWLHFVEMPGPLVYCGTLLSHDPRDWGLRLEHFHGWNPDTEAFGGHYHHDVTPETAEYTAYFSLGEVMLRVDPPGGVEGIKDD